MLVVVTGHLGERQDLVVTTTRTLGPALGPFAGGALSPPAPR